MIIKLEVIWGLLEKRGRNMPNSYLRILSNVEYPTTRCQDGIILFWPLESDMHVQNFVNK